ncbi:SPOR domain-containing protein [Rhizobacter sp. SG703]|uniref:SPOR domain-containing protein n=1 Tax=Rhizobacter sp. SG703 TaxID=2587140 RepID=UPI0014455704|nr:SPOR domain-containing protein [Rhizobacter sp. SG703]NKI94512.1 cell division protein FtsN [Rhizobacter sp. SG703]
MKSQRGGFVLGLIVGLLIGLALALGVALYIAKVPVPFINKVPQRTAEQDAAEAEKNKNWDPNGSLSGKVPVRMGSQAASGVVAAPAPAFPPSVPTGAPPVVSTPAASTSRRDPAAILEGRAASTTAAPAAATPPAPVVTSTKPGSDALSYFVQAGAFGRVEDAEQQRAKLAMMGLQAKITEREQAGRTMFRVRLGPYDKKEDADLAKEKLDGVGVESALVRVQK